MLPKFQILWDAHILACDRGGDVDAKQVPGGILDKVRLFINKYDLIAPSSRVALAFSGGKDSTVLGLALTTLGYSVTAIAIDMGYEPAWGHRIAHLAARSGFGVEIVTVRDRVSEGRSSSNSVFVDLKPKIQLLDLLDSAPRDDVTPCTLCYNVKAIALYDAAQRLNIGVVALGHHATDARASLLKEALMYIDRWDRGHERYVRDNFVSLVAELRAESAGYQLGISSGLIARIATVVYEQQIDTDEPPRQALLESSGEIEIVRPLGGVPERDIVALRDEHALETEGSGCGHSLAQALHTPRELVHYEVLRQPHSDDFETLLDRLVGFGIDDNGRSKFKARGARARTLGSDYKLNLGINTKL